MFCIRDRVSLDQVPCSSDTGDVLIRSSRIQPGPVRVTVHGLDALVRSPLPGAITESRPETSPEPKSRSIVQTSPDPGHDLLTSRFAAGGRGVVMAALKQRSHSAPPRPQSTGPSDAAPGQRADSHDAPGVQVAPPLEVMVRCVMEDRVCELTDGIQRLIQNNRETEDRGRSLTEQTLRLLENLQSHHLLIQSQLLESALRISTSHTPLISATSDLTTSCHQQDTNQQERDLRTIHLRDTDVCPHHHPSSSSAAMETSSVTMVTPHHNQRMDQTSDVSCQSLSLANQSQAAARANEVLKEMERLKVEMKTLLMPEDPLKTTRPGPAQTPSQNQRRTTMKQTRTQQNHLQSKKNHTLSQQDQTQNQQNQLQFHSNETLPSETPVPSQQTQTQSHDSPPHTGRDPPLHTRRHPPQHILHHSTVMSHQSRSVLDQGGPVVPSLLDEAGHILHCVQRQRKLLEENLDAQMRAQTGEVLHCQLEALSANRDCSEEVHIKKTVNAWISSLTTDIQAEMASGGAAAAPAKPKTSRSSAHSGPAKPVSALRGAGGGRTAVHRASGRQGAVPDSREAESHLSRLYGRAPHDGLRRTLKKTPYLRFRSPASPQGHKPRPRLVESIRGVTVKSCKTQTSLAPPPSLSPEQPVPQYFSSAHLTPGDSFVLPLAPSDGYPVAMAIPLGRPRINSSTSWQQQVTSPPIAPPTAPPTGSSVGADSDLEAEPVEAGEALPSVSAIQPSSHLYVIETKDEEEEEENVFPGTDFVSVVDVAEEEVPQDVVQVDGGPAPPPVRYQGPLFPPQAPPPVSSSDQVSLLGSDLNSETLENRLVDWVEQTLMSRMISEMYCPPSADHALNDSTDQSERDEQSVTSDIAGGASLQVFVDSVSLDSDLLRNLVLEVLTETMALMLGQRDPLPTEPDPPRPGPAVPPQDPVLVPRVPTPQATPPSSPTPLSREVPPLTTPPPSGPPSLNEEPQQPITEPEPVTTPISTPEPPADHQAPPPPIWGDAELPLAEERPQEEEHIETHPQPVHTRVMTAEEEPAPSTPLPPPGSPPCLGSGSGPPSPLEDSSASSSSSSAVTSGKHISEGEVLSSVHQGVSITEEEFGLSFSGSLQELQEMDSEPLNENQVKGHEALLTLMTKKGGREPRPQAEGSWRRGQEEEEEELSIGEVRGGERTSPGRTANQGELTSDLYMDLSLTPPPPPLDGPDPGLVLDQVWVVDSDLLREDVKKTRRNGDEGGGVRRMMDVHVPAIRAEDQDQDGSRTETDASSDVF